MGFPQLIVHIYTTLWDPLDSHGFPLVKSGDAVDIHWIPLDPTVFSGFPIEPNGILTDNHEFIQETMGSHGNSWDPIVSHEFP